MNAILTPPFLFDAFTKLPIQEIPTPYGRMFAILGGGQIGQSFKDLLGIGMVQILMENGTLRPGGTALIDSSGNASSGVALAGRMLGVSVVAVSSPGLPRASQERATRLGATFHFAQKEDPVGGWQASRAALVEELRANHPGWVFLDQNNDPSINVGGHERLLIPHLERTFDPNQIDASVFCVGSGGHFSAISKWLKRANPRIRTYAADREGSVTFGGESKASFLRGVGNMGAVPRTIAEHMHLVDGVVRMTEEDAIRGCRELSDLGIFVGGSSGLAYAAATELLRSGKARRVLTLFADRFEPYLGTPLYPLMEN